VFGVWCLVFGVGSLVFGVWCLVFGVCYLVFGVWCLIVGAWCLVFGVWWLVLGVWCLVFGGGCPWCAILHIELGEDSIMCWDGLGLGLRVKI